MFRLTNLFPWIIKDDTKSQKPQKGRNDPLREFVYLDEVSLASLLASQKGELTDNTTSQYSDSLVAEVGGAITNKNPLTPTVEVRSRFQTTNSSSMQTMRKANAQSLFRELHELRYLRKISPVNSSLVANSIEDLSRGSFDGFVHKANDLNRGDLIELNMRLSASWIFQMSAMVAEFSEMFDESPSLFMSHVDFVDIYQAKNVNKVIGKLLAGLIPIDGVASEYVVVDCNDEKLIVHKDVIKNLNLDVRSLRIVGVTDHQAYWRDIRRVLFSDNEFTILCRLSKSGIQDDWNPIKVADIFRQFAPDLALDIEKASKVAMAQSSRTTEQRVEPIVGQMALALVRYKDRLLSGVNLEINDDELSKLDQEIASLPLDNISAEGQRLAFARAKKLIEASTGGEIDPAKDFAAREFVRKQVGLPLFPVIQAPSSQPQTVDCLTVDEQRSDMLDVEVVAIYW